MNEPDWKGPLGEAFAEVMNGPRATRALQYSSTEGDPGLRARLAAFMSTRGLAVAPVIVVTAVFGEGRTEQLLVLSQVVLSMQLPFAIVPLLMFVGDRRRMGPFVMSRPTVVLAWAVAALIISLNLKLLWDTIAG